jgi:hypothetical protein
MSRKRSVTSPPTVDVGPIWLVRSSGVERYVSAKTVEEAVSVFHKAVVSTEAGEGEVIGAELIARSCHAEPGMKPAKTDGHK